MHALQECCPEAAMARDSNYNRRKQRTGGKSSSSASDVSEAAEEDPTQGPVRPAFVALAQEEDSGSQEDTVDSDVDPGVA